MMKKKISCLIFVFIIIYLFCFIKCKGPDGEDGADGDAYIAISWVSGPFYYWTDDPAIPQYFYSGTYYKTSSGIYYFEYESWDTSIWSGSYEIYINQGEEGEPGGLFWHAGEDGADGADIYFELACYSFGPSFYTWDSPYSMKNVRIIAKKEELDKLKEAGHYELNFPESSIQKAESEYNIDLLNIAKSDISTQYGRKGSYGFVLRYSKIK